MARFRPFGRRPQSGPADDGPDPWLDEPPPAPARRGRIPDDDPPPVPATRSASPAMWAPRRPGTEPVEYDDGPITDPFGFPPVPPVLGAEPAPGPGAAPDEDAPAWAAWVPATADRPRQDPREPDGRAQAPGRPATARPDPGRPDAVRPDTGWTGGEPRPDAAGPDRGRPDPARPDPDRPGTRRPGTRRARAGRPGGPPGTERPGAEQPGAEQPGAGGRTDSGPVPGRPGVGRPTTAPPDGSPRADRPDTPPEPEPDGRTEPVRSSARAWWDAAVSTARGVPDAPPDRSSPAPGPADTGAAPARGVAPDAEAGPGPGVAHAATVVEADPEPGAGAAPEVVRSAGAPESATGGAVAPPVPAVVPPPAADPVGTAAPPPRPLPPVAPDLIDRADAAALAGAFAADYLSWDEDDPARRGRALSDHLPGPAADRPLLGWSGHGRQRAEIVLPGSVRPDGDGRVLVDVRVRVTPYRRVSRSEAGPEPEPGEPFGGPAAAPSVTARGWRGLAARWVRLGVTVTLDGDRLVVDAGEETIDGTVESGAPSGPTRPARPVRTVEDLTLDGDDVEPAPPPEEPAARRTGSRR